MNQTQIWKEYQKLRACLKQLNQEVLYHMEKKAFANLGKNEKQKPSKDLEGTLVLFQDEKKSNDVRLQNYNLEFNKLDERIKILVSKPNMLDDLNRESNQLNAKIKQIRKDNRDLSRNAELQGRDLINNTSILDKLMIEQQKLTRVFKQHKNKEETIKIISEKIQKYKIKIIELQKAINLRVQQFSKQQNFIAEDIHFDNYQKLKKQKDAIQKYEPIYKRNYLMKLKDLQILVNSISKHEKIIHDTEGSILTVRNECDSINTLVGAQRKRYHSSVLTTRKIQKPQNAENRTNIIPILLVNPVVSNDKNEETKLA